MTTPDNIIPISATGPEVAAVSGVRLQAQSAPGCAAHRTPKMRRPADDKQGALGDDLAMSFVEIRAHLLELAQERVAAEHAGLDADPAYMADLEAEMLSYQHALVGALVTEIATFRGELFGRNTG